MSETLVVEELVSHFPFPNSQGELHLLSILPTNQSPTLRSHAHISSSIRNLIPPQASSLSRLFSCYESQTTQPCVQKNDFLQISLISHVMLLLCQVDRKFITVILEALISLPGSHGKVMWPHAGPTFWGSSVYFPYWPLQRWLLSLSCGPFRSGCCLPIFVLHLQNDGLFFAAGISPNPSQAATSLGYHSIPLRPCHLLGALPPRSMWDPCFSSTARDILFF